MQVVAILTIPPIGNIELCVNGSYYDLCADQLTPEQALFLCRSTGETYDRAYLSPVIGPINETFSYDPSSDSVANSSCPYSYFSSSCSFDLVYGNGCANNGGVAIISCIRGREHYQYCLNCHLIVPCILACSFGPVCVRKACTYTCYYFASCKLFSMHCVSIWLYTVLIIFIEAKFLLLSADGRKCIFCREKIDPFFVQIVY